jgi:hypothetical protein
MGSAGDRASPQDRPLDEAYGEPDRDHEQHRGDDAPDALHRNRAEPSVAEHRTCERREHSGQQEHDK